MNIALAGTPNLSVARNSFSPIAKFGLTFVGLYALGMILFGHAFAQTNVFNALFYKATDLFYNFRYLVLIIAALGVIGLMVGAFAGRFPVTKAVVFSFAIVVIAASGGIVSYLAQGSTVAAGASMGTSSANVTNSDVGSTTLNDTEGDANTSTSDSGF